MKQISIFFGQQRDGILGSYADVVTLELMTDEDADEVFNSFTRKGMEWVTINTSKGKKTIRVDNILWFDINNVDYHIKDIDSHLS